MARRRGWEADEDEGKPLKVSKSSFKKAMRVFSYISPYRLYFVLGIVLLGLSSVVFMIFPVASGELINIATGKPQYGFTLPEVGIGLLVILVLQSIVSFTRVMIFTYVSEKSMADIRKALYNKIITFPTVFFEKNRVGELTSRTTTDVQQLDDALSLVVAEFLRQIVVLSIGITYLFYKTPDLALVMLATFPIIVIFAIFFGRYIRRFSKKRQDELAATNVIIEETLQSISAVKAFTNELFETVRYGNSIDRLVVISLKFGRLRGAFVAFVISVLFGVIFFVLWQGAIMVQKGQMSSGDLVSFIALTAIIGGSLGSLGDLYTQLLRAIGASERIMDILDEPSEVTLTSYKENYTRLVGNIRYENVRFSYPTRADMPVLKGISFEVEAGKKIALVGTSGAGKSTIVQLLMRFYDLESGTIKVDEKNINDFNITEYRQNLAIVPQEVLLFGGTIRENIRYGKPTASDAEIISAAQQANAWDFISSFPEGLETIVGERGVKLSGGQRQRVAIARAILRNPSILILDEATSSLDAESERVVQDALDHLMQGRTSIIIAHRLATVREVDCIYVIDKGMIVEKGTHEELSTLENGIYNNLARLQFELV